MEKPHWIEVLSDDPLCFELTLYDRWAELLRRPFGGIAFRQTPGEPFFIEYTTPSLTSRLWLLRIREDFMQPVVVGFGEPAEEQIEPWRRAVAEATRALDLPDDVFAWRAVLGPSPSSTTRCVLALAEATTVGEVTLRPAGVKHVAYGPVQVPQYGSHSVCPSWPFFVEGASRGYNWNAASTAAAHTLHKVATLVSLAWHAHWTVQHLPAPVEQALSTIPSHDPFLDPAKVGLDTSIGVPQSLPEWVARVWPLLDADEALTTALGAHHEGLAMREEHPSFAAIAFVAAIESLGAKVKPPRRCEKCKNVPGAAERFRSALQRIMPEEKVSALTDEVYGLRSETAHKGALHGSERHRGALPYFGFFDRPSEHMFAWTTLRRVAEASRSVLLDAVTR